MKGGRGEGNGKRVQTRKKNFKYVYQILTTCICRVLVVRRVYTAHLIRILIRIKLIRVTCKRSNPD